MLTTESRAGKIISASSKLLAATITRLITWILLLFFGAVATSVNGMMRDVDDLTGRQVQVPISPQRLISLSPGITEMVFSLEREELLLATTEYSNHPPAALEIPRIGPYVRPDLEQIIAHKPDLVLATRDGNPQQLVERLERLHIPVYAIDPRNLHDIQNSLLALGELLNAKAKAETIVSSMRERLLHIDKRVALALHRPLVFFQVDVEPLISIGEQTFLHELIVRAGGRNAAATGPPYPRFGWEDLLTIQPEVVIISSMSGGQSPEYLLQQWQRWPQLDAVKNGRIHIVDADLFDRPTQRLVDGLEGLARLIQPELFADQEAAPVISSPSPQ